MPKHDIICMVCGEPATRNCQKVWQIYPIDDNGDYDEPIKELQYTGDESVDLCDECEL